LRGSFIAAPTIATAVTLTIGAATTVPTPPLGAAALPRGGVAGVGGGGRIHALSPLRLRLSLTSLRFHSASIRFLHGLSAPSCVNAPTGGR